MVAPILAMPVWTFTTTGGGSVTQVDGGFTLAGPNQGGGSNTASYTAVADSDFTYSALWHYTTTDSAFYDRPLFLLNGVETLLVLPSGGQDVQGSILIELVAGDLYGWAINATDSCCGAGFLTITDPTYVVPSPTPEPSPEPSPLVSPSPDPTPSVEPSPEPTPEPSPSVEPSIEPTPTATPEPSPSEVPSVQPSPIPSPTPTPKPSPTPDPTPEPSPSESPSPDPTAVPSDSPSVDTMAFRLRIEKSLLVKCLSSLTPWLEELDSNVLANMEQSGGTETETETETDPVEQVSIEETFNRFWKLYPSIRKVAKQKCFERWKTKKYYKIADQIIGHVEAMKQSKQWKDGYSPAPITYIQQMRWLDDIEVERKPWEGGI